MGTRQDVGRLLLPVFLISVAACGGRADANRVILAATTTIRDSGLLAELVETFQRDHPRIALHAIVAPSGRALALARAGDADVLITHAPAAESAFVAAGQGTRRIPLMRDRFVIVGPATDPADLRGMRRALADAPKTRIAPAALARIARTHSTFVSRADGSGTHRKELALWLAAGLDPNAAPRGGNRVTAHAGESGSDRVRAGGWYLRAGAGMAEALRLANTRRAYILADEATFLNMRDRLQLQILVEGGRRMVNRYAVIPVSQAKDRKGVRAFVDWITGRKGREIIGRYGTERFGRALFEPIAPSNRLRLRPPVQPPQIS